MTRGVGATLIALVAILVVLSLSLFTVDQRQNAIVFRLGEPRHADSCTGLKSRIDRNCVGATGPTAILSADRFM